MKWTSEKLNVQIKSLTVVSQIPKIYYPSTNALKKLRRIAQKARSFYVKDACPKSLRNTKGWCKSPKNPMELLAVFKRLSLNQEYVLRAYVFSEGGNGNGIVWAMPKDSQFPEPDDCEQLKEQFLSPPKPDRAVKFEDVLRGNGRPWSYLEASLFIREAREFGAQWHGCFWSDVSILERDPFTNRGNLKTVTQEQNLVWKDCKPKDWRPQIVVDKSQIRVCFYIYNPIGSETISRIEDVYIKESYSPEIHNTIIAQGPGGIIY